LVAFVNHLPDILREKVQTILEEEAIDDDETLDAMKKDDWKKLGFKLGEIKKIEKAFSLA